MPFQLCLYRAPEGLGPMHTWEREHRESLGSREQVQAAVEQIFPGLHWEEFDGMLFASHSLGEGEPGVEITLFGAPTDNLLEISVYSFPPAVRAIMSGLKLDYCYAQESGEFYFPFQAGDRWPIAAR